MLRIITAATALTVLVACDSEGIDRVDETDQQTTIVSEDPIDEGTDTDGTGTSTDSDADSTGSTEGDDTATDDTTSGDSTSDSSTSSETENTDTNTDTNTDVTGSATSDGGQNPDVAASGTSDNGESITQDDDTPAQEVDGGSFATDTGDGNTIRVSSLASDTSEVMCTSSSDPDDYSNIYIGDFILHNNAWRAFRAAGDYEQCIYTNRNGALVGWNYDWGPGIAGINGNPRPSGDYYVRSYPELIYGIKDEFRISGSQSETGLPVRISEMPTFQIDYSYDAPQYGEPRVVDASNNSRFPNGTTISGERNVAVESFFYQPNAEGQCTADIVQRDPVSNHAYEVMIWLDAGAERLPAGPDDYVADVTIRDQEYKVYTKDSDNRYIAFVAQNPQTTGTIYMNDFVGWASANAHQVTTRFGANSDSVQVQDYWCMANVLVGTEIFWGAGAMDIMEWTITQTQ